MVEWIQGTEGAWTYVVLFLLAAAPWLEVFLVIPLGIGFGLNPAAVAIIGFSGNWIPILLIALFFEQFSRWRARRKAQKQQTAVGDGISVVGGQQEPFSKKQKSARRIWEKYGVPGLCLLAPIVVGTDIAMILALVFGSPRRSVFIWMTISLLVWTLLLTFGTLQGISFFH